MLFLIQDGITNGAIYALLGLALVLVFAVTRVILIPQGEFVTYGALTYASLSSGQMPGTAKLAMAMGAAAFVFDLFAARRALDGKRIARAFAVDIICPVPCSRQRFGSSLAIRRSGPRSRFRLRSWLASGCSSIASPFNRSRILPSLCS